MTILRHRTVLFLIVIAALWAGWEAYLALSAPFRVDPRLAALLAREPFVNVAITLPFAPEDFHIRIFQAHGVVSGVRETTVLLNRVTPRDVSRIAHYYWVRRISLQ